MLELSSRIQELDINLFEAIPSQTSADDKRSLLLLQRCVRNYGDYIYLEIGSHLGGTIQTHYGDPRCRLIYSIDKRPLFQPDERGERYLYSQNSTATMLKNLRESFPYIDHVNKLICFDNDASEIDTQLIAEKPHICLIDGEHTNKAVFSDFKFCLQVGHPNAIIAFHDSCFIFKGINLIKDFLKSKSIRFRGFLLGGSVYAIFLNDGITAYFDMLEPFVRNESAYFKKARRTLRKTRLRNKILKLLGKSP